MEVMTIYEVYVDVHFVENMLLDMLVLLSVSLLFGKKTALWRLLLSSALGGAGAVLILWLRFGYGVAYLLSVLVLDIAMCLLLFASIKQLPLQVIYFHGLSFVYTKISNCLEALGITRFGRLVSSILLVATVFLVSAYKKRQESRRLYAVRIMERGKAFDFKALFDTGNSLIDPYTGKPVSIVEENEDIRTWIREKPQKYRLIPFRSLGKENGLLEGTEVDELIICGSDGQKTQRGAVIALYKGKLSGDGSFQMILNQGLF